MSQLKQQYYSAIDPKPTWPMEPHRLKAIYGTMQRTIRQGSNQDKTRLLLQLMACAQDFATNTISITQIQTDFDQWHGAQHHALQSVPFSWMDAGGNRRGQITFGLSQKFLNLILKDWWCVSPEADIMNYPVLHAPFDNVVRKALWRIAGIGFPSLRQGGYYVYLSRADYDAYQEHLLSGALHRALGCHEPVARIEADQMLWGLEKR